MKYIILAALPLPSSGFAIKWLSCFGEGGWIPNLFSPKPSQDHREASHKISSQSEQYLQVYQYSKFQLNRLSCFGERAWILQLFSLKPSLDQEEASHKISSQQVQPFHKQTTFYFYSIALYINYYKNRFFPDFRRTGEWIRNFFGLKPSPDQNGGNEERRYSIGLVVSQLDDILFLQYSVIYKLL